MKRIQWSITISTNLFHHGEYGMRGLNCTLYMWQKCAKSKLINSFPFSVKRISGIPILIIQWPNNIFNAFAASLLEFSSESGKVGLLGKIEIRWLMYDESSRKVCYGVINGLALICRLGNSGNLSKYCYPCFHIRKVLLFHYCCIGFLTTGMAERFCECAVLNTVKRREKGKQIFGNWVSWMCYKISFVLFILILGNVYRILMFARIVEVGIERRFLYCF